MLTHTLPQLVQDHREQVVNGALERLRREKALTPLLSDRRELLDWFDEIVASMDRWPGIAADDEQAKRHRSFGALCAKREIALHEIVHGLHVLKGRIVDFARSQGMARNSLEIHVEGELEHRVSFLFDWLLYLVALGYESAQPALRAWTTNRSGAEPT